MSRLSFKALVAGLVLLISASISAASVYAQPMPSGFEEVSGRYTNADAGVEITFPDGWSGFTIGSAEGMLVATSPGGLSEEEPTKSINLVISNKLEVDDRDPSDPSSFSNDIIDCNTPSIKSRTVAGVDGTEITVECPATTTTWKMVAAETEDRWVAVMYMAPTSEFNTDLGKFDAAVNSLRIQGAIDSEASLDTPTEQETTSYTMDAMVGEESIDVQIESSSEITDFGLDEETKTLAFTVDGDGESTIVSVGYVLEGPYVVMVDGQETSAFEESTNEQGVKTVSLSHDTGAHEVTITGTQVVPEFPVAALAGIAALIGIVAIVGRTRFMGRAI